MPSSQETSPLQGETITQQLTVADYEPGINPFQFNFYRTYITPPQFNSIEVQILTNSHIQLASANMNLRHERRPNEFMNLSITGIPIPSNFFVVPLPHIDIMTLGMGANGINSFTSNTFNPDGVTLIQWRSIFFSSVYATIIPIPSSVIVALTATGVDATVNFDLTTFVHFFRT